MPSPIVITGGGAVCGAGLSLDAIWNAVCQHRSAVKPITHWDATHWPVRVAAEVAGVDNRTLVNDRRLHKIVARTDLFGLYAADVALRHSGLLAYRDRLESAAAAEFHDRSGVFVGSGGGSYGANYEFFPLLTEAAGDLRVFGRELTTLADPMWLLRNLPNNVLCHVGIRSGFKGANACITNQCVGGVMAVAEAAAALAAGEADRVVVVAHDMPIEPETLLHYHQVGLLAQDAVRPFDSQRTGTVLGEGAAALVLETAAAAQARQAIVLGELLGSGCTSEATGLLGLRADGDGLSRAIHLALDQAGLSPGAVGMIVAHANGTTASDASEAAAIRRVFGKDPPPVTGFKWAFGHLIAASGALDLLLALRCLAAQVVPGVPTLTQLDPALAPFPVSSAAQPTRSDLALTLCRGFGGMNVAVVVRASAGASVG
jgi:3-oxoacyl-[acyl-carrier-protein] synthase-1